MNACDASSGITADVLIVGFGPVGKLLAIQLGRAGHAVVVVDRNEAGYPLPRAVTHCSDFARILQSVGLHPDTIPAITEPYDDMYSWRNSAGETLLDVDWSGIGESGWYNTYFFHQPALEDALDGLVARLDGVRVLRGWEAIELAQTEDDATVVARSISGADAISITAQWVVGADGANSQIRSWAGIDWHDEGYFFDWLVVDVKPRPHVRFPHVATQHCDYRRPSTMVPGGPGRRRWEFMRLPHETREELDGRERAWELLEPFGLSEDDAELERHSVYTFQACWATEWRRGRVLLAGDAAHLMPPFAGQGLGAGARDAMNLGWKLDAVLRGCAGAGLIDTYGSERLHHAKAFVNFSTWLGKVICLTDPEAARARDIEMIAARKAGQVSPTPPRPGLGPGLHTGTHGGQLARQGRVGVGGEIRLFDDAYGGPGALITRRAAAIDALPADIRVALKALGITPLSLTMDTAGGGEALVRDVDGCYARWLEELDVDTVLIRPDFHVYGTSSATDTTALAASFLDDLRR